MLTARRAAVFCLLVITALCRPAVSAAGGDSISQGAFGLGLNYPGLGARYFLTEHYCLEAKGQFEKDILVGGLRAYRYFRSAGRILPFIGLEADYVHFKGEVSKGSGFAGELFAGGEYFFTRRFSAQLDFGPAYISLKDQPTAFSVGGIEYVLNFGINFYFMSKAGS
jgi:hypothetical protein